MTEATIERTAAREIYLGEIRLSVAAGHVDAAE